MRTCTLATVLLVRVSSCLQEASLQIWEIKWQVNTEVAQLSSCRPLRPSAQSSWNPKIHQGKKFQGLKMKTSCLLLAMTRRPKSK